MNLFSLPYTCTSHWGLFCKNEYQKKKKKWFWGVECGQSMRLRNSPPSVRRMHRQCGILYISQPYKRPWPVMEIALLFTFILFDNKRLNKAQLLMMKQQELTTSGPKIIAIVLIRRSCKKLNKIS
jgi:hypothetical protein